MKEPGLPERDRQHTEAVFNRAQHANRNSPIDKAVVSILGAAAAASLLTEGTIAYSVFSRLFAPDVPGEAAHGSALVMSLSTVLAAGAFHLYLTKNPEALAGRLLNRCIPALTIAFVVSLGLMAMRGVLEHSGIPLFGADGASNFMSDEISAPETSLVDKVVLGAFGLGLAGLAVVSFWMTQRLADLLWSRIKGVMERRAHARETRTLMEAINADEARRRELESERQKLLRELEPKASREFANELAALVQELRGPIVGVTTPFHIWAEPPESVLKDADEPKLNVAKYEAMAAALDLTPQQIYAAFHARDEGKRK
jgi:hypothetical protein